MLTEKKLRQAMKIAGEALSQKGMPMPQKPAMPMSLGNLEKLCKFSDEEIKSLNFDPKQARELLKSFKK